jgi:hypothetical protein
MGGQNEVILLSEVAGLSERLVLAKVKGENGRNGK